MTQTDPHWYKDAIIYQLHVKAFFDADNDGTGDFAGLTRKLDYITDLGATAIWLLPFYPSPLKDDGYDIAQYKAINSRFGRMRDFRRFLREAHRRNLRVITELVINHTSDQHAWFQRARRSKPGSAWRNYYVWSDTDHKYLDTRIIFTDTETSNWAWDPLAQAYYWHRFFSHQPDLNFDNPRVLDAILNIMKFWLDMGVDGLRLDAIPYLCEREGTSNENLPETHAVLKKMRQWLDANYPDRMFLGEANQWPEDVLPYFGDEQGGLECHMNFHFPLMPRMYMALAQEDRHPVSDIMRQTPDIPDSAQWAIFLRNHDELTLEMVTDRERDYLWNFYASDPRMRINLGIRRRLAPLLDNDRNKMQLLNSLLMSMPGTPIVYYGDEIGMGDNIFLGDRDSVRTPMQWTPDRNGGFSAADPPHLYLPPLQDPLYGYEALNVEAQQRNPSSFLTWMKRLITVRKSQPAFSQGKLRFLYPGNRRVLAYLREFGDEVLLCVANLARTAQPVELNLSEFRGRVPVELMGDSPFPPIGELPYFLTLSPHGFYWFQLTTEARAPRWHTEPALALPEFFTLVLPRKWESLVQGRARSDLENRVLPDFLAQRRWFAGKKTGIERVALENWTEVRDEEGADVLLSTVAVDLVDGARQHYFLPLTIHWGDQEQEIRHFLSSTLGRVRSGNRPGFLLEALGDGRAIRTLLKRFAATAAEGETGDTHGARFTVTDAFPKDMEMESLQVVPLEREQSNTSLQVGDGMILKAYRRLHRGIHPEVEIGRFLTDVAGYTHTAPLLGALEFTGETAADATALLVLQGYVPNQGDGWSYTLDYLDRSLHDLRYEPELSGSDGSAHEPFMQLMSTLGRRVAELHRAFDTDIADPAFRAEAATAADMEDWRAQIRRDAQQALHALQSPAEANTPDSRQQVLRVWSELITQIDALMPERVSALKTRCHGDLHLGQVLVAQDDFYIVDFEGEPERPFAERRAKHLPLRDLAGLLRSIEYAALTASLRHRAMYPDTTGEADRELAREWCRQAREAVLSGYRNNIAGCRSCPTNGDEFHRILALFMLEKTLYEVVYEANNRPDWLHIPITGLLDWLDRFGRDNHGK